MKKEITLNEDKTEVTICLSLTKRYMARDPRMTITTKMVKTMLENDNFKLDKCLSYDTINNDNENSKHDGKWVFSLVSEIKANKSKETGDISSHKSKKSSTKRPTKKKAS
tara:strand:- start:698 stop:1027 length:330 start_codon:yes stop_codon:yes gene_type:complete